MEPGQTFPHFELPDQDGKARTLSDLAGSAGLVLYAYPKDDTPGCTVEAQDFRDLLGELDDLGFAVAGLSPDGGTSHCQFIDKYGLTFPLLSDPDRSFMATIGAFGEKTSYGKTVQGVIRSTIAVAPDGTVIDAWHNVRAKGHAGRVLEALRKRAG
jgi:peroxiredoxin Q/BCP